MTNPSGTWAETQIVGYLNENGFPGADRQAKRGSKDVGDLTGTGPLCWESKNYKQAQWGQALDQTLVEQVNRGADFGILVQKRKGKGARSVGDWYACMTLEQMVRLLRAAGYGDPLE